MGLFDRFKSNKSVDSSKKQDKKEKKENVLDMVKEEPVKRDAKKEVIKNDTGNAYKILVSPQISEKATTLSSAGKYVFKVNSKANKSEVKKAIEKTFDVHVKSVNIINVTGKKRRYNYATGRTKDWKKAIVTVAEGERIEGVTATETA